MRPGFLGHVGDVLEVQYKEGAERNASSIVLDGSNNRTSLRSGGYTAVKLKNG